MARLIQPLQGHSGCAVGLWKGQDGYFVRKTSPTIAYNVRLEQQSRKQTDLANFGLPLPRVLQIGYRDRHFYFDMAYAPGIVADQAILGEKRQLDCLVSFYSQIIGLFRCNASGKLSPTLFTDKIINILSAQSPILSKRDVKSRITRIGNWLVNEDWQNIPQSPCHGDLTLENTIMSKSDSLILIDCLDGPLNSYWLDVAKLYQDLKGHWFLRAKPQVTVEKSQHNQALLNAAYVGEAIRQRLEPNMPSLFHRLNQFVCFQLFRIVPYCVTHRSLDYTLNRLEALMSAEMEL